MTNKGNFIKVLGVIATVLGVAANLTSEWVSEKKMDEKIEAKVQEALAVKNEDDEEES